MKHLIIISLVFFFTACGGGGSESPKVEKPTSDVSDNNDNTKPNSTDSASDDSTAPLLVSLTTDTEEGAITLTFNEPLDTVEPSVSDFQITQDGESLTPDFIAIDDNQLIVTINGLTDSALQVTYKPGEKPIRDAAGNESSGFVQMVVSDGYIRGAEIYADANSDGIADESELVDDLTTDALGQLLVDGEYIDSQIIVKGGINVDTGAINLLQLSAPVGYSVINPLSTLVQQIIASDGTQTIDQAEAQLTQAFGLTLGEGLDLSSYDPISDISENAVANRVATSQIATFLAIAAAADASVDSDSSNIEASVLDNLTELVKSTSEPIKQDANTVEEIFSDDQDNQYDVDIEAATTAIIDMETIKDNTGSVIIEEAVEEIIQAQAIAIDKKSPAIPTLELTADSNSGVSDSDAHTNQTNPTVTVSFDTQSLDGSAVIAGDYIELFDDGVTIASYELQQSDIDAGFYTTNLSDLADGSELTATIKDLGGNESEESLSTIIDTFAPIITSAKNAIIGPLDEDSVIYTATVDNSSDASGEVSFSLEDTTLYLIPGKSSISIPVVTELTQLVYVSSSIKSEDGLQETVVVSYTSEDESTTGLGLRVHFDSSKIDVKEEITNIDTNSLIGSGAVESDSFDLDNDNTTDKYIIIAWGSLNGSWPGSVPIDLATITFNITEGASGTSAINFSYSSNAAGYDFFGQNHEVVITEESDTTESKLTIDPVTGEVMLVGELNPVGQSEYSFAIIATDLAGNESSQTVTLTVNNN